ncbi:MAG: 50S ribosomal protein L35 [Thermodesulfobacteriota bacterium]
MPKMKTNRSAAKRFYKTSASGKVKRFRGGKSHLNQQKSRKRVNRLASPVFIGGKAAIRIKKQVPYL